LKPAERDRFEDLKERKQLRDELQSERRRKALAGLEIPAKTQPPKKPRKENPLPGEFIEALWGPDRLGHQRGFRVDQRQLLPRLKCWLRITEEYPGALNAYVSFLQSHGQTALARLVAKGANLNFILSLLVMYLWNENVSPREHESAYAQHWQESLAAIRKIKNIYPQFINRVHGLETYVDANNFELALLGMEKSIENFLNGKDFRKPGRKRPPEDKVNRVIFTLYEYLKQQTRGPHWQTVLDLFVAAGAIKMGVKKRRKNYRIPDNPDRRIATRLRGFQNDHPKEACYIKEHVVDLARLSS
jgi:hypothetical protein